MPRRRRCPPELDLFARTNPKPELKATLELPKRKRKSKGPVEYGFFPREHEPFDLKVQLPKDEIRERRKPFELKVRRRRKPERIHPGRYGVTE